jgi:hypothetical protein
MLVPGMIACFPLHCRRSPITWAHPPAPNAGLTANGSKECIYINLRTDRMLAASRSEYATPTYEERAGSGNWPGSIERGRNA